MHTIQENFNRYKSQPGKQQLNTLITDTAKLSYQICLKVSRHHQNAEDTAQLAILKIIKVVDKIGSYPHFFNTVYRISIHTCINEQRARKRRYKREQTAHERLFNERHWSPNNNRSAINEYLELLSEEQYSIITEYYFEGKSLRHISSRLNCSSSTISTRLKFLRNLLKQSWNKDNQAASLHKNMHANNLSPPKLSFC